MIKTSVNMMPPEAHAIDSQTIASGIATGNVSPTGTHNWATQYLPQFGNKTIGNNLWTAMTDNGSYPFETRPGGGLNGAWNNTSGYGLAYVAVTLTQGKLYRIRFDASSVSGVASYIGTASNSAATNWKNKALITNGTNLTSVFRADSQTAMIVMHTANGAAAFTLSNMTLYEVEEPNSQAEVAKAYLVREFGNGSANGNADYADASLLTASTDDIAYVMDDGLTSLSATDVQIASTPLGLHLQATDDTFHVTFIGTGLTIVNNTDFGDGGNNQMVKYNLVQNLPYGTHILEVKRTSTYTSSTIKIDGVQIYTGWIRLEEVIFHQPKKPPIPEEAVVLCDYMLMADFVPQTNGNLPHISKGVRYCSVSRDSFIEGNSATSTKFFQNATYGTGGFQISLNQNGYTLSEGRIVGFGHSFGVNFMRDTDRMTNVQARLDGSNYTYNSSDIWDTDTIWDDTNDDGTLTKSGSTAQEVYGIKNQTLGIHTFGDKTTTDPSANKFNDWIGWQIATPIHTSHHYQSFETPFLHELVGGDRNMEQHNLVCSPNGKTWDEVTRNSSYIGKSSRVFCRDEVQHTSGTTAKPNKWRGVVAGVDCYNKDFAIAYDKIFCLVEGMYCVKVENHSHADNTKMVTQIYKNTVISINGEDGATSGAQSFLHIEGTFFLQRGDYIRVDCTSWAGSLAKNFISIERV